MTVYKILTHLKCFKGRNCGRMNLKILGFGLLLTFFSSFGQTFLISIFVPEILATFVIDAAQFGMLYAAATLVSALCLPYLGRKIDHLPLRRISLAATLGLMAACLMLALAPNVLLLFSALLGLRLCGQGLLSLIASTTMARSFERGRGRALSFSALGYPLGEALLPLALVLLIQETGWRTSWGFMAGACLLILLPAILLLLDGESRSSQVPKPGFAPNRDLSLLRDKRFYALLPSSLFLPLVLTALFLYQIPLAAEQGWSVQTMATAFVGFAVGRVAGSLLIGAWIDRYGALRLYPYVLLPICAGLLTLSLGSAPWPALVYLTLAGVSQGLAGPTMTALWAEVYGVAALGATKGTVATLGVFATAIGPPVLGLLLKADVSFALILPGCALLGCLVVAGSLVVRWRLTPEGAEAAA
jgi:MFS family permease